MFFSSFTLRKNVCKTFLLYYTLIVSSMYYYLLQGICIMFYFTNALTKFKKRKIKGGGLRKVGGAGRSP